MTGHWHSLYLRPSFLDWALAFRAQRLYHVVSLLPDSRVGIVDITIQQFGYPLGFVCLVVCSWTTVARGKAFYVPHAHVFHAVPERSWRIAHDSALIIARFTECPSHHAPSPPGSINLGKPS